LPTGRQGRHGQDRHAGQQQAGRGESPGSRRHHHARPITFAAGYFILRSKGIKTLVLGGFLTNCCVESTMRSGYENGYTVITLSDCLAATSAEEHDNALRYDFPMFSQPMTAAEFINAIS
jgi:hypothetical protein